MSYFIPDNAPNMKSLIKKELLNNEINLDGIADLLMQTLGKNGNEALVKKYQELIELMICDIQKNEEEQKIRLKGAGRFSFVLQIGNKILKIGYPRYTYEIPHAKEILQPIARKEFDNFISIEVSENVKTDWYQDLDEQEIENKIYQVWKSMRQQGAIWMDANPENMGILLKDNIVHWKPYFSKSDNNYHTLEVDNKRLGIGPKVNSTILRTGSFVVFDTDLIRSEAEIVQLNKRYEENPDDSRFKTKQYIRYRKFEDMYQAELLTKNDFCK